MPVHTREQHYCLCQTASAMPHGATPMITLPAVEHHRHLASTKLDCLMTKTRVEYLTIYLFYFIIKSYAQGRYIKSESSSRPVDRN